MRININTLDKVYKAQKSSVETMELKGYELIEELFVDSSGFGLESEPALTQSGFEKQLANLLREHGTLTAKITGAGMFQVYVGLFKKTGKSKVKRISTNVLERIEDGAKIVRLYETDILRIEDKKATLYNGGYQTVTTKKWLNEYLSQYGLYVSQKNWEWYIHGNGQGIKFHEGIEVSL